MKTVIKIKYLLEKDTRTDGKHARSLLFHLNYEPSEDSIGVYTNILDPIFSTVSPEVGSSYTHVKTFTNLDWLRENSSRSKNPEEYFFEWAYDVIGQAMEYVDLKVNAYCRHKFFHVKNKDYGFVV